MFVVFYLLGLGLGFGVKGGGGEGGGGGGVESLVIIVMEFVVCS